MGVDTKEIECYEQQFIELVSEFQALSISEGQLREALRAESARAEAAEASHDVTRRANLEARSNFFATSNKASQMAKELAAAQEELTTVKMQLEFADRQCRIFEEKYTEMVNKTILLEKELQNLRPLQATHSTLQRQYTELQERVQNAKEEARNEALRLENELRRVERCVGAGTELRERARLAAAAHARERRLASAELQHTARELKTALAEITRQGMLITELECRLSKSHEDMSKKMFDPEFESLIELKATLDAERAGTKRLEKALAEALADNANLAAQLHNNDNTEPREPSPEYSTTTNICPIDLFLAE